MKEDHYELTIVEAGDDYMVAHYTIHTLLNML